MAADLTGQIGARKGWCNIMQGYDLLQVLDAIDPARCSYEEWCQIGMALKEEGFTAADWERWSARDSARFHAREIPKKWEGFGHNPDKPVAGGYIVHLAREQGWTPPHHGREDRALEWDDVIGPAIVEAPEDLEAHPLPALFPVWSPCQELSHYLELLFSSDEVVGYVTETWYSDEKQKYFPTKGSYTRTAGDLIADLSKHGDDLGAVIGDINPDAGAWIRFNPLDGQGVRNENVTEFRYALVESDSLPVEQQYALYQALELPARVLVHSGGKSLHAIVHIDAGSYDEYRKRVAYLYKVCEANGLKIDGQNKNPSRLSRMPGATRGGRRQYIVVENIGRGSFEEWQEYIESVNDDLPDPQNLSDVWDAMPALAPPLIRGVLRQGHKMLLAGPSKAGKSFALLELCIAIAEGVPWLGFQCAQGRVLYVNLELDPASCWNRVKDVYAAMGVPPRNIRNIDVWNLRGAAVPMDRLAPKLIRRAQKKGYLAVVIDPIYKVITGDENSADQMAKFCNQFDLICARLGCAVIYCHHHSKMATGYRDAANRASGSGVFARDPDAMMDMVQLALPDAFKDGQQNKAIRELCRQALETAHPDTWEEYVSQDDLCSSTRMEAVCATRLNAWQLDRLRMDIEAKKRTLAARTAWRIEFVLREFRSPDPVNAWFSYPVHYVDREGELQDVHPEEATSPRERGRLQVQDNNRKQRENVLIDIRNAIDFSPTGSVAIKELQILNKKGNPYSPEKISAWFGEGKGARPTCKKEFEKYIGDDRRAYLRRRENADDTP